MKKTYLYIGGFELPDKNAAAHRVLAIAKALRDKNINVIFIGISKTIEANKDILLTKTVIQGFDSFLIPYPKTKNQWLFYLTNIQSIIKVIDTYSSIEGIICYNYQAIALEKLRKYCTKRKIKIYADCTEWYGIKGYNLIQKILKGFDTFYRMRLVHKRLDGMIVISRFLQNYYKECKNVVLVPPLIDIKEHKWGIIPKKLPNSINFVYSGNPGIKDKLDQIISTLLNIKSEIEFNLWIIGISKEEFINSHKEYVGYDFSDTIHFLGRISHEENLAYLKAADCSLIIRDKNRTNDAGFPTKFVEAVTLGINVIASDISDLKDYLHKVQGLYIIEDSFFISIQEFLNNESKNQLNSKSLNTLFDYRTWTEDIYKLIN